MCGGIPSLAQGLLEMIREAPPRNEDTIPPASLSVPSWPSVYACKECNIRRRLAKNCLKMAHP